MTVASATSKVSYAGNGVSTSFAFPFRIFAESDVRVVLRSSAGVDTVQTLSTHYTVSAAPWTSGGTITMVTPPATGEKLIVKPDIDATQGIDYRQAERFPAETHEAGLDRLTLLIQQIEEALGRTLSLQESTAITSFVMPDPESGNILSWDGAAFAWVAASELSPGTVLTTAFSETLLAAATAAGARVTLGEDAAGSFFTRKHNFSATAAPAVTDDTAAGYAVGSWWYDTTNDLGYTCLDASASAAVWQRVAGTGYKLRATHYYTYDGTDIFIDGVDQNNGANTTTWSLPAWCRAAKVKVQAPGGGGGGADGQGGGTGGVSGAGGGGGYTEKFILRAALGATETITVGAIGAAGAAAAGAGGTGGTTSFGAHLVCTGGAGGSGVTGSSGNITANGGAGGTASTPGDLVVDGQNGGIGYAGGGVRTTYAAGGSAMLGRGGVISTSAAAVGVNGENYGGGASGAQCDGTTTNYAGGTGGRAIVIVEEYE